MGAESRLLLDERPLVVIPELAVAVGLNKAIAIQQIHYWVKLNQRADKNFREGHYWTYNSYEDWKDQFPFWSISTIKRIFLELESEKLIITGNFNRLPIDRTKWYRLNYELLNDRVKLIQSDSEKGNKVDAGRFNLNQPLPEINTDIIRDDQIMNIWIETLESLKEQVSRSNFTTWLKDIVPLSFDGEVFVVGAKNNFVAEYLKTNMPSLIENCLSTIVGKRIKFVCQIALVMSK